MIIYASIYASMHIHSVNMSIHSVDVAIFAIFAVIVANLVDKLSRWSTKLLPFIQFHTIRYKTCTHGNVTH